jgi:hypothetical protein
MSDEVRPEDLEEVATRVGEALGDAGMLVGGMAVSAWGHMRSTDDIDFVARVEAAEVVNRLEAAGLECEILKGNILDGDIAWCVKGYLRGVRFDVLPPLVPLDFDRSITLALGGGHQVRVVDLDGLLRLKLRAGGPQDLLDAAQLLRKHPEMVDKIRPVAEAYRQWERLEGWMNDPRLR